ncbi:MAG TPA: hypothetical protein VGE74_22855 [Gemmata sp.]
MRRTFLLAAIVAAGCSGPSTAAPPLTPQDAVKLRALIRPVEGEDPFEAIPWETNLWAARKKAAESGKPLLLWEMDGHPLGCG